MALLVVAGFLYWVLATTAGGRWALVTAVMQTGGTVSGVSGSVWKGLHIGHLKVAAGQADIDITNFQLQVQWPELLDRQLHIEQVSAERLDVALTTSDEPDAQSEPFVMPDLPVQVRVDRMALGELLMSINGEPIPVSVGDLATSLYLGTNQAQLGLSSLDVGHDQADVRLEGDFHLNDLNAPWPFNADFVADVQGRGPDSLVCAQQHLATLPRTEEHDSAAASERCDLDINVSAKGDLHDLVVSAQAAGQGMDLDAMLNLTPMAAFPLKDGHVDLTLADTSSLHAKIEWVAGDTSSQAGSAGDDHVSGTLRTTRLNVGQLVGPPLPVAVLTTSGRFDVQLKDRSQLVSSTIELDVSQGSVWNDHPLEGLIKASINTDASVVPHAAEFDWRALQLRDLDIDVRLGGNHVQASGGFGWSGSEMTLNVQAPALSSFWPDLPGGVDAHGQVGGMVSDHAVTLDATYTPDDSVADIVGKAPAHVNLDVKGGWGPIEPTGQAQHAPQATRDGWRGRILELEANHAGLGLVVAGTPSVLFSPDSTAPDGMWRLGSAQIDLSLDKRPIVQLVHQASSGGSAGQWATAGQVERIAISQRLIDDVQQIVSRISGDAGVSGDTEAERGGVKVRGANNDSTEIVLALDWDFRFDRALAGTLNARYLSGDLMVPADPPFPLGLQTFTLDVTARSLGDAVSQLGADLTLVTSDMGRVNANVAARLRATAGGGFELEPVGTTAVIAADIDDLGWLSLFAGDAMEFAGQVQANVTFTSQAGGQWDSNGTISGSNLRIVRIDDGVRLLDGTLSAHFENDRIILDRLEFPAVLRVEPKEWRTAEWISTNPDARGGYLRLTGEWRLSDMAGDVDVELHRYPILQRADRYAMVSGKLHVHAALPALSITGSVEADAGWIDLDMLGGIPTIDSDVIVIRAGHEHDEVAVPMDISMDIEVDLGPRVYLTGYGVNSGLVGNMRIMMINNQLTAVGALRTRGGAIEAYGQRLQLRRGTITFQGDITNPILSIEALRTGQAVEAGVRVSGTARRPTIGLVSYPDVSDIEKLSWLLFGHGPDESGGDMALLLSVGTSFLGDGEPFYRRFGIDELSLQSGDIGSAGSILPAESVVSGLNTGASELERQFIVASKGISDNLTLSVRQALSDAGTVGRASYRLARGLNAELSLGTVNGLALVYRWFSRD